MTAATATNAAALEKGNADATVDDVTDALDNATITDKTADDTTTKEKASADAAASASAAEGRRLYIGNLAYATTEPELKEFFQEYVIESVSIPKNPRTERAVGYAFVDLSTPSEAERAIAELSGKEILERKVSVQLAHKPEPAGERGDGAEDAEGTRRRSSTRGRARNRGRGGRSTRGVRTDGAREGAEATADTNAAPDATEVQPLADITKNENTDMGDKKSGARPPRERRERGPPADGVPSKTKVMVANLPYDLTEDQLKELFVDYQPSSAKIALRPIPKFMIRKLQFRNEARKGRGFGFVTLASEELQKKAVDEMNGKEVDGREIAVKIAIDSPDKTDEALAAAAAAAAAAATGEQEDEVKTNGTENTPPSVTEATATATA